MYPMPTSLSVTNLCVCVCVCVCVCQRKTKDRADSVREKSAHSPRQDSNLYLWDTHPSCFRLHHEGRLASRQSKQTLQTLTPSSIVKYNHAKKQANSYLRDRDVRHLQGPPLSRTKRVRERQKRELHGMREKCVSVCLCTCGYVFVCLCNECACVSACMCHLFFFSDLSYFCMMWLFLKDDNQNFIDLKLRFVVLCL